MELATSLFLASLPKSLSSFTYHVCRRALDLREPSWTSDGEILNPERFVFCREPEETGWPKYVPPEPNPLLFGQLTDFLGQITSGEDSIYKDVIQPFVVSRWLPESTLHVLKITRNLTDVVYAMQNWKWSYPQTACDRPDLSNDLEAAMIVGLDRAQRTLARLPGESIDYDDLIADETPLWQILQRLYPDRVAPRLNYLDDAFRQHREKILSRRLTDDYQRLQARVLELTSASTA